MRKININNSDSSTNREATNAQDIFKSNIRDNHMAFIFQFVNVVYYIGWFADIEESLHHWDKAHSVMIYDLFNMLLVSVC